MRTPFLHRSLAEFAASLPISLHAGPRNKHMLRSLTERMLPELGGAQPKTAFRVPLAEWLRGPLRPALEAQVARGQAFAEDWLDRVVVRALVEQHVSGRSDHSRVLWSVLAFGSWLDGQRGTCAL